MQQTIELNKSQRLPDYRGVKPKVDSHRRSFMSNTKLKSSKKKKTIASKNISTYQVEQNI